MTLVCLFAGIVCLLAGSVICRWLDADAQEKIGVILLGPVTVLVGPVVGFYFGEQRRGP